MIRVPRTKIGRENFRSNGRKRGGRNVPRQIAKEKRMNEPIFKGKRF